MLRLPEEIQVDVFLRLPAKSLLRCRCVCKPLCRLLYNPKFIKDHLNHNKKNPNLMFIVREGICTPYWRSLDYDSISASAMSAPCTWDGATPNPMYYKYFPSEWNDGARIVGSCNGLICTVLMKRGPIFYIWNPSTGKPIQLTLPQSPLIHNFTQFGFGYDCHLDVYKVIKIVVNGPDLGYSQVEVYTLGGIKSWKTIRTMNRYTRLPVGDLAAWFLNGALHWKGLINAKNSWVVISFDISSYRFVDFLFPKEVNSGKYSHLGLLEDHLCLVVYDYDPCKLVDVWVMQDYGVSDSWTKQFSFNPSSTIKINEGGLCKLLWSSTNGEVLIDGGCYGKLLYNPKNGSTRILKIPGFRIEWSLPVSYVDSLVSLRSPTFVWERNATEVTKKQRLM